jgi:hypothetical protein
MLITLHPKAVRNFDEIKQTLVHLRNFSNFKTSYMASGIVVKKTTTESGFGLC